MATIRTRETKKGLVYTIQVKIKDNITQQPVVKTMTWAPQVPMTDKKALAECQKVAEKFEADIKRQATANRIDNINRNIKVSDYAKIWLGRVKRDFSLAYYEMSIHSVEKINSYIGNYKVIDVTPYIIQGFFDRLDEETYTVFHVTAKPCLRKVMEEKDIYYRDFRYKYKLNSGTLSMALRGKNISLEYAKKMADILGVKVDKIFNIEKEVRLYAAETTSKIKRATQCIFALAKRQRLIEDNIASADYVSFGKRPQKKIVCLDDKGAKILCSAALQYHDIRVKTCILILLLTGMRRGEVAGLEWSDIDFKTKRISVQRTSNYSKSKGIYTKDPKTKNSQRTLSISDMLVQVLKEYKEWYDDYKANWGNEWINSNRLFTKEKGEPADPNSIDRWLNYLLRDSNLPHVSVHSLRHTNITLQINAGVSLVTVSSRAGHSRTSTTTDVYSHFILSNDEVAANTLNDIFSDDDIEEEDE